MQSRSISRPFKPGLIGASPITDANVGPTQVVRLAQLDQSATVRRWRSQVRFLPWTPFASVPQQPQGEFCKLVFVGASPTTGSSLRLAAPAWQATLW